MVIFYELRTIYLLTFSVLKSPYTFEVFLKIKPFMLFKTQKIQNVINFKQKNRSSEKFFININAKHSFL